MGAEHARGAAQVAVEVAEADLPARGFDPADCSRLLDALRVGVEQVVLTDPVGAEIGKSPESRRACVSALCDVLAPQPARSTSRWF
jgi:hypothetical protein